MSADHDALLADLRVLVETVLDRIETAVQQTPDTKSDAAAAHSDAAAVPASDNGCTWCPLCAVAALLRGENHELIDRLASHLAALMALVRELLARYLPSPHPGPDDTDDPGGPTPEPPARGGGFVPISVTIRP
ncbi:hypothetical protein [Rhodococcus chondri]|uniref:Uncharacterized protein n=1 Tax=Rhodococcus chondri TaxID=3065941 RepID=A0ABU7JP02_9NOCA|nr:hypothetical protein [Rhodococcus sp. CC-R104]MEE2031540.1 hypothetical protein [Rhodococcus sp. CC-R104]